MVITYFLVFLKDIIAINRLKLYGLCAVNSVKIKLLFKIQREYKVVSGCKSEESHKTVVDSDSIFR